MVKSEDEEIERPEPNGSDVSIKRGMLVVGDWVVDRYLMLSPTRMILSSHTGSSHSQVVNQPGDRFMDLCGAGHVARVLYDLRSEAQGKYEIHCLGLWNSRDDDIFRHLLHGCREITGCRTSLAYQECDKSTKDIPLNSLRPSSPTLCVERHYTGESGERRLLRRIDYPQNFDEKEPAPYTDDELRNAIPGKVEIDSIIVFDLGKGAVTKPLIDSLDQRFPGAAWYVRTKGDAPSWMNRLRDKIKLVLVGPERAAIMNPTGHWLDRDNLTRRGYEVLLGLDSRNPGSTIVILTENQEIIVKLQVPLEGEGKFDCITGKAFTSTDDIERVGWSSAIFSSLVDRMRKNQGRVLCSDLERAVKNAHPANRQRSPGVPLDGKGSAITLKLHLWEEMSDNWCKAFGAVGGSPAEFGILGEEGDCRIEVFRACAEIPGYISCVDERRLIIRDIAARLRAFKASRGRRRPLSIRIVADSGTGKTSLINALANSFNFYLMTCDVSELVRRQQVIDFFDSIAAEQARGGHDIMVFIDELNALLEGDHVYSLFLSPLEAGRYVRSGKDVPLAPCVWMFVETPFREHDLLPAKLPDFLSRLSVKHSIDYTSLRDGVDATDRFEAQVLLERVYLGATMVKHYHPEARFVSKELLEYFRKTRPGSGERVSSRKIREQVLQMSLFRGQASTRSFDVDSRPKANMGRGTDEWVRLLVHPSAARE